MFAFSKQVGDFDTDVDSQRVLSIQLRLFSLLALVVLGNLLVNLVELPDPLVLLYLHHGLVTLQHVGLHLVKRDVAGSGRSLWALGYTNGFPE
jgi:hypothetical protein